jgi:hypothetical protein
MSTPNDTAAGSLGYGTGFLARFQPGFSGLYELFPCIHESKTIEAVDTLTTRRTKSPDQRYPRSYSLTTAVHPHVKKCEK